MAKLRVTAGLNELLSLVTFFAAAKKVTAAPHRGSANRPPRIRDPPTNLNRSTPLQKEPCPANATHPRGSESDRSTTHRPSHRHTALLRSNAPPATRDACIRPGADHAAQDPRYRHHR